MPRTVACAVVLLGSLAGCLVTTAATAQTGGGSSRSSSSNLLNPSISVVGWFQAQAGTHLNEEESAAFEFHEAELAFQADVDPYSRADIFVAVSPEEGVELEEATLAFLALPGGISAKAGKFRSAFSSFNRIHPPETPFADRPLSAERFLGEEGLAAIGASAAWLIPNPLGFYANLDVEVTNTPEEEEAPSFAPYRGKDLLYLVRASGFVDLSEAVNVSFGGSLADGANGSTLADSVTAAEPLRSRLYGLDATLRWKNPRRAIYRSLTARLEWIERRAEGEPGVPDVVRHGGFAALDYQFARRWHVGGRYDRSDRLEGEEQDPVTGVLGYLTFNPSEFSSLSIQARRLDQEDDSVETAYFLKATFNIGPHGAHPF